MENHAEELNKALHADDFNEDDFVNQIKRIVEKEKVLLRILDFTYFNERRLEHVSAEKIKAIKAGEFESAALWRQKEIKVLEYIEIRKELKIQQSGFRCDKGYLFYFHLGTAKNDPAIKKALHIVHNMTEWQ